MKIFALSIFLLICLSAKSQYLSDNYEVSRSVGFKQNNFLDLNSDGILDMVTLGLDDLAYYKGNGNGTYGMKQLIRDTLCVGTAQSLNFDHADFNLDGKVDLVVATGVSNTVEVYMNNGVGFNKVVIQNVGTFLQSVFCLDMTGDGLEDVLTGHYSGQGATPEWIRIYVNQGGGNFSSGTTLVNNITVNDIFKLKDMDNDGDEDIVKRSSGINTSITIIKNTGTTFTNGIYYSTNGKTFTEFDFLDVDNDGFQDIVIPFYNTPTSIHWWKNMGNANTLTGYDITVPTRANSVDITTKDIDQDNIVDVVMTTANTVYWYKNTSGTFQLMNTLTTGLYNDYLSLEIDNLNGDTLPDLSVLDVYGSSVHLNTGAVQFSSGDRITQMPKDPMFVDIKDIDNDGFKDVIYSTGFGPSYIKDIVWHKSEGNNHFNKETVILRNFIDIMGYEVEDVDNDGDNDIVLGCASCSINSITYTNRLIVMKNNGSGSFTTVSNLGAIKAQFIQVADIDNDLDKDIVAVSSSVSGLYTVKIFWSVGTGYTEQTIYNGTASKEDVFVTDMNGDSKKDIVIKSSMSNGYSGFMIWFNNGSNAFPTGTPYARNNFRINVNDFDNDGDNDVMKSYTVGSNNEGIMLLKNNGAGIFTDSVTLENFAPAISNSKFLYPIDYDSDLDLDLFTLESDSISYYENLGGGNFAASTVIQTGNWLVSDMAVGNIDGDALKEIVTASEGHDQVMTFNYVKVANTPVLSISNNSVCIGSTVQINVNNYTELNQNVTWALFEGAVGATPIQTSTTGIFNVTVDSTTSFYICGYGGVNYNGPSTATSVFVNQTIWEESISACGSYTWAVNGTTYTSSGNYSQSFSSIQGCDSIMILNLIINSVSASSESITTCNNYYWPTSGITYSVSGNYNVLLAGMNGCDSIVTLNLTISQPSYGIDIVTACDSFTWIDGVIYTSSTNNPTWTISNSAGCDSIISLDLTINTSTSSTIIDSALDSYTLNGINYTVSGSYVQIIPNANDCDSTIHLDLSISYTGIKEMSVDDVSIYPNPSIGILLIDWDETNISVLEINLLDNNGRIVKDLGTKTKKIDLNALDSGVYYIKIVSNQGISYNKWIRY